MLRLAATLLVALGLAPFAAAQDAARIATAIDCQTGACDRDFFQTELALAQLVRDRADADVSVLILEEDTGGGGERYTLYFEGRRGAFAGRRDTLTASVPPGATDDDERRALLSRLSLGLAGFAARAPRVADRLSVVYAAPAAGAAEPAEEARDPWDGWVVRLNGRSFFNGESSSTFFNGYGSLSGERVTDALKLSLGVDGSYNRSTFSVSTVEADGSVSDTTFVSARESFGAGALAVRSLGPHVSAGASAQVGRQTFRNYDLRARIGLAAEYNVFPYAESTQRQLRLLYSAGVEIAAYVDTTLFDKTRELLPAHQLTVATQFNKPWGDVDVSLDGEQYLSKPDKYQISFSGNVGLKLVRGLRFNVGGRVALVRDQLFLPAAGATREEVLTQQQALATNYEYFGNVGLSYSFGSINNPVVNPRFGRGRPF